MGNFKFLLSGGGTGGHIYPAIAIANELRGRYPKAEFLFVGALDKMEMEKVPEAGYNIRGLWISGFQRRMSWKNLMFPIKVIKSLIDAKKIVTRYQPDVVIGTGGYASGPVLRVASGMGIPCLLQEQNSFAGITNKLLAGKAERICVAYDGMDKFFPAEKIVKTGNPVRDNILAGTADTGAAYDFFRLNPKKTTVLVLGGSLGARRINELLAEKAGFFANFDLQLLWQCGTLYYKDYMKHESKDIRVLEYIKRMDLAYAVADIIISRAGAGAVSELSVVGKPVIFIPSPNVAEDHQTRNAQALVAGEAALMIGESMLGSQFEPVFTSLYLSMPKRKQLGQNIRKLAMPDATKRIADEIGKLLERK